MRVSVLVLACVLSVPLAAQEPVPTAQDTVRANLATARSDLRNLVVAQEAFYADHGHYTSSLDSMRYVPSRGSSIAFTVRHDNSWGATLKRDRLRGSCIIWVGLSEAERPKTSGAGLSSREGEPLCDAQPETTPAVPPSGVRPPR
jgi:hypothetical protein